MDKWTTERDPSHSSSCPGNNTIQIRAANSPINIQTMLKSFMLKKIKNKSQPMNNNTTSLRTQPYTIATMTFTNNYIYYYNYYYYLSTRLYTNI